MKKSVSKIIFKTALITLGVLLILAGIINPLTYYFGFSTTATCDSVIFTQSGDGLYERDIKYHYFVSGKEYNGEITSFGEYDESITSSIQEVKYFPLIPSYGILKSAYSFPHKSVILATVGLASLIIGLVLRTVKKEKKIKKPKNDPKAFICPACRKEIDSDSIYCNYCGRKILYKD